MNANHLRDAFYKVKGWVVECECWRSGTFTTREAAERRLALIGKTGACHHEHRIVEVPR